MFIFKCIIVTYILDVCACLYIYSYTDQDLNSKVNMTKDQPTPTTQDTHDGMQYVVCVHVEYRILYTS